MNTNTVALPNHHGTHNDHKVYSITIVDRLMPSDLDRIVTVCQVSRRQRHTTAGDRASSTKQPHAEEREGHR
ncbi:hypothetical protein Pmar_PMAR016378 [Perkinsus marinus ATCC 50983]|uniref:Uncharacterized protein n=1 Tax=Perkinsus marinus (strain ATCC 50983 / TXsc) TaxID=423536 RepID=C5L8H4_PERM5|nr:hypothetical protein Pmar_PMAR016378 [Perkinsus marinus ATCC 50983]EER06963.1 hypothetical protein Pmar_PMAR016378 [Perkinsus marinus ATCC 50983]|eukprot:XP_002775147.1 hypothetical protein Pmar_PMAR016378 [Perkinsus marinus ATCC 50983]